MVYNLKEEGHFSISFKLKSNDNVVRLFNGYYDGSANVFENLDIRYKPLMTEYTSNFKSDLKMFTLEQHVIENDNTGSEEWLSQSINDNADLMRTQAENLDTGVDQVIEQINTLKLKYDQIDTKFRLGGTPNYVTISNDIGELIVYANELYEIGTDISTTDISFHLTEIMTGLTARNAVSEVKKKYKNSAKTAIAKENLDISRNYFKYIQEINDKYSEGIDLDLLKNSVETSIIDSVYEWDQEIYTSVLPTIATPENISGALEDISFKYFAAEAEWRGAFTAKNIVISHQASPWSDVATQANISTKLENAYTTKKYNNSYSEYWEKGFMDVSGDIKRGWEQGLESRSEFHFWLNIEDPINGADRVDGVSGRANWEQTIEGRELAKIVKNDISNIYHELYNMKQSLSTFKRNIFDASLGHDSWGDEFKNEINDAVVGWNSVESYINTISNDYLNYLED